MVESSDYDFVCVSETWIQDGVFNSELFPVSYDVFRCDRDLAVTGGSRGGGVLLAVRGEIGAELIDLTVVRNVVPIIDVVACKVNMKCGSLIILVLYVPPNIDSASFDLFFDVLCSLDIILHNRLVVVGDFNAAKFVNDFENDSRSIALNIFSQILELKQVNEILNCNDRMLDLIFSNIDCTVSDAVIPLVAVDFHHPPLQFVFSAQVEKVSNFGTDGNNTTDIFPALNFRKANFPAMYRMIHDTDWSSVLEIGDPDFACTEFYSILTNIFSSTVPLKKRRKKRFPTWYTSEIMGIIFSKERALRNYRKHSNNFHLARYKTLRSVLKSKLDLAYSQYIVRSEEAMTSDPSNFWSFIQEKKNCSRIPGTVYDANRQYNKPVDIVNAFGNYFSSVYEDSMDVPGEGAESVEFNSDFVGVAAVTEAQLLIAAKKLSNKHTAGPDGIPSFVVKDCIRVLVVPLLHIFNRSLAVSAYPAIWKSTKIIPVLKKGDKSFIGNYRPIAILCNFSKLFEVILYNSIFVMVKSRIKPEQHGFMPMRSSVTNLVTFFQYNFDTLDRSGQVDVIYTDFCKAFDSISHELLIMKLRDHFGFSSKLSSLLGSYLFDRLCYVQIENFHSDRFCASSGVPQGSNLGPLLFLLFINDLMDAIHVPKLMFADDLKIFLQIGRAEDCGLLQSAVDGLVDWCKNNSIRLNVQKCNVMTYSRKKHLITYNYLIQGQPLLRVSQVRDLGVTCDPRCSFVPHINQLLGSVSKTYGFIVRNTKDFSHFSTIVALFNSLIRSKLEYCSLIWRPIYACHKYRLESIQRKFYKYLVWKQDGIYPPIGFDHETLLNKFGALSLEERRDITALSFIYKLMNGQIDDVHLLEKLSIFIPRLGSRSCPLFYIKTGRTNLAKQLPLNFMSCLFNSIAFKCDIHHDSFQTVKNTYLVHSD